MPVLVQTDDYLLKDQPPTNLSDDQKLNLLLAYSLQITIAELEGINALLSLCDEFSNMFASGTRAWGTWPRQGGEQPSLQDTYAYKLCIHNACNLPDMKHSHAPAIDQSVGCSLKFLMKKWSRRGLRANSCVTNVCTIAAQASLHSEMEYLQGIRSNACACLQQHRRTFWHVADSRQGWHISGAATDLPGSFKSSIPLGR